MPLYKTIAVSPETKIYIWNITETFQTLFGAVILNEKSQIRLASMKSEMHQRGFLSVRKLLQEAGFSDHDLHYDSFGKPHLNNGKHISITHSHYFSAIIISNENCGIDMEMQREKIIKIAPKFIQSENAFLDDNSPDYIQKLTIIWGIKEAIFKIRNEVGISFKDHISVAPFTISNQKASAQLHFDQTIGSFVCPFETIENFTLVYAFQN
jgi:phosphopantetheinyl transferase